MAPGKVKYKKGSDLQWRECKTCCSGSCSHLEPTLSVEGLVHIRPIYRPPCLRIVQPSLESIIISFIITEHLHGCRVRTTWCIAVQTSRMASGMNRPTCHPDCHQDCSRLTSRKRSCSGVTAWAVCTLDSRMAALRPIEPTAIPTCTGRLARSYHCTCRISCDRLCLKGMSFNCRQKGSNERI